MISRMVKVQLVVFVLLSFAGVVYTGLAYVGIAQIGPWHLSASPYTVRMELTDSGGIYSHAPVTLRGVQVGTVSTLRLAPTENPGGVEVDLKIDHKWNIPMDTTAQVANLSAVGEQYVNLTPQSDSGPFFRKDGKTSSVEAATYTIPTSRTSVPVDDAVLLKNLDLFVNSVNKDNLATVIHELAAATNDTGPDLQKLIDSGNALLASAQAALPQTLKLIDDGKTVLNTQAAVSGDFQAFSHSLNLLSQQLVSSDPDLRRLFDNGVTSAQTLNTLLLQNEQQLPTFFSNLVTLGQLQQVRLTGLQSIFVLYPLMAADTPTALDATDGSGLATAQFVATTTSTQPSCSLVTGSGQDQSTTGGYQSTKVRSENPNSDGASGAALPGFGGAANLNTLCTDGATPNSSTYNGKPQAATGGTNTSAYRGAGTVPRPAGDTTGVAGGSIGTSTNPAQPNYYYVPYSATSGDFQANGVTYRLDNKGQQATLLGGDALGWLLTSGAS